MGEPKTTAIALKVLLKPSESSAHPRAANYANVSVAQGIAYLDFGFIEPAVLAAIAKTAKDGHSALKGMDGHLVTRVAMDLGALTRLQRQIQQMLVRLQTEKQSKSKGQSQPRT